MEAFVAGEVESGDEVAVAQGGFGDGEALVGVLVAQAAQQQGGAHCGGGAALGEAGGDGAHGVVGGHAVAGVQLRGEADLAVDDAVAVPVLDEFAGGAGEGVGVLEHLEGQVDVGEVAGEAAAVGGCDGQVFDRSGEDESLSAGEVGDGGRADGAVEVAVEFVAGRAGGGGGHGVSLWVGGVRPGRKRGVARGGRLGWGWLRRAAGWWRRCRTGAS